MQAAAERTCQVRAPDLAVLLRHVLRADAELSGSNNGLIVPAVEPWPTRDTWERYGMRADGQRVFADPWQPDWLDTETDPSAAAVRGSHRHSLGARDVVTADPFFAKAANVTEYRSTGQREAIRAVLATPPAATIIGNLPTGTGKSMVAYISALVRSTPGTTIVVVPTTSLDHTEFPNELAYHGELADGIKATMRQRIAEGTQRILFTSPEALMRTLSVSVYTAAERGLLTAFVIDEAHIVSQWGSEFRPDFQAIAGVRADLLKTAANCGKPFRTILLSATLTEESLFTLQNLFGRPGPTEFISSVALRDEPSYWIAKVADEDRRTELILDCIRHLPRPLVLYTTKVDDAKTWFERLHGSGFRRLMLVQGETRADDRGAAIHRLREGSLDLVVATSAFGLGVDQPDMRSVLHACIPETIDRFYQEAGRGGRDGRPSVSILVATPRDEAIASDLSTTKYISLERGFERWRLMHSRAKDAGESLIRVPLWTAPADLTKGDTAGSRAWNMRTLLLMDRSNLIKLESSPPPRHRQDETDEQWEHRAPEAFEDYASHALLGVRKGNLADQSAWEDAVGNARGEAITADRLARKRMGDALEPGAELCSLFASTYRIDQPVPGIPTGQIPVPVAASCGGCPGCRKIGRSAFRYRPPTPRPATSFDQRWHESLEPWFGGMAALAVTYEPATGWEQDCFQVMKRLARLGMWCLVAPERFLAMSDVQDLYRTSPHGVIFHLDRWDALHAPNLPTGILFAPGTEIPDRALTGGQSRRVVMIPSDARHPNHPTATVAEYHPVVTITASVQDRL
jgi:superfamily II DNA or RNA helicase